jgi:ribosome-binding protein 1
MYQGRQDPVVKLKKQLAEKEKALQEEQEAGQSLQSKLKELRSELNSERSRLTHSCRQLDETLVTKQNEIQSLNARLQHTLESHVTEKQALTQQYQQVRWCSLLTLSWQIRCCHIFTVRMDLFHKMQSGLDRNE